jgi:ATP-dependent protease ClpP protease subunit
MNTRFNITNSAEENTTIDILGSIGESFFDEGVTMHNVAEQIPGDAKKIVLNISSLGGSLVHALAIHDILKVHPAKVEANWLLQHEPMPVGRPPSGTRS